MTTWTPRPRYKGEPACWSWPVPPTETVDQVRARLAAGDDRLSAAALDMLLAAGHTWDRFNRFHQGRCAACGEKPVDGRLVEDHCHSTGQIRGYLCRSCNTREARTADPLFARYRAAHPAAILDFHEMYDGIGWTGGWSWATEGDAARTRPTRPATPWPEWGDLDRSPVAHSA